MTNRAAKKPFKDVEAHVDLNELENAVLQFWKQNSIFQKSIEQRPADKEFIFYDGPPFANGLPHYGHILTSYVKDTVPRYFTMRGFRVERRFGWDCHGLPAENSAEKDLNISGKKAIEDYGIANFNDYCRGSVLRYTQTWRELITRLGRWVDFDHDYKTMDSSYMESILWVFKTLYDRGLIYEGNKVLHYCYRCQTPLSNFEAGLDDAYRLKKDLSVTVKFKCLDLNATYFLVWTTTPWTLPSNVALAVGADFNYVIIRHENENYILAADRLQQYETVLGEIEVVRELKGSELVGMHYEPLFPYFKDSENGFRVYAADFVNTEDGTGIVHIAPAFGEDDANLGRVNKIVAPDPVDSAGRFTAEVTDFVGQNVHEANPEIVKLLQQQDKVIEKQWFEHNYPFCWRCDTPLIYKAIPSWYLEVTKIKEEMLKNNELINWVPAHIKHGIFAKWLEGAKDWAISRNRYWGSPVPVWKCDKCKAQRAIGSFAEIEELTGKKINDLHRPQIDEVTFKCEKCSGTMHRVSEVLDCWFESGSMPYAQLHYPFENQERFNSIFPADFIVEYISQTRGWFYTLLILSTALFDKPPFLNAVVHGVIFAEDGRKMSKRLKNYPDPREVLNEYGSDAMRFYLLSSAILSGKNLNFAKSGVQEVVKDVILPLWNAYRFFVTYANADNVQLNYSVDKHTDNVLDRYILAKLQVLIQSVETDMQGYDLVHACREIASFLEVLNNTYIRRSRRRFWKSEQNEDKQNAYETLCEVLTTFCKVAAPFLPFVTEHIFKALSNAESVHLTDWPTYSENMIDHALIDAIEQVQQIIKIGRMIREKAGVKIREPRQKVTLYGVDLSGIAQFESWITEELNVKELQLNSDVAQILQKIIKLDFKKLGRRLGKEMQSVNQAVKQGDYKELADRAIAVGDKVISSDEYSVEQVMPEGSMQTDDGKIMVALDMTVTDELRNEGMVRDLVRAVQILRKNADFDVSDRIRMCIEAPAELQNAFSQYADYIQRETLCKELTFQRTASYEASEQVEINDLPVTISVSRI